MIYFFKQSKIIALINTKRIKEDFKMNNEIKALESQLLSLVSEVSEIREKQLKEREIINGFVSSSIYETIERVQRAFINEKIETIKDISKKIDSLISEQLGFI